MQTTLTLTVSATGYQHAPDAPVCGAPHFIGVSEDRRSLIALECVLPAHPEHIPHQFKEN